MPSWGSRADPSLRSTCCARGVARLAAKGAGGRLSGAGAQRQTRSVKSGSHFFDKAGHLCSAGLFHAHHRNRVKPNKSVPSMFRMCAAGNARSQCGLQTDRLGAVEPRKVGPHETATQIIRPVPKRKQDTRCSHVAGHGVDPDVYGAHGPGAGRLGRACCGQRHSGSPGGRRAGCHRRACSRTCTPGRGCKCA